MGGGWVVGGWVLDFTRLMLISTLVEVVVEVEVELGNIKHKFPGLHGFHEHFFFLHHMGFCSL